MTCSTWTLRAASTPSYRGNLMQRGAAYRFRLFFRLHCIFFSLLFEHKRSQLVSGFGAHTFLTLIMSWRNIKNIKNQLQTIRFNSLLVVPVKCCLLLFLMLLELCLSRCLKRAFVFFVHTVYVFVLNTSYKFITTAVSKSPEPLNWPYCNYRVHTLIRVTDNSLFKSVVGANVRTKHCIAKSAHIVVSWEWKVRPQDRHAPFYALRYKANNFATFSLSTNLVFIVIGTGQGSTGRGCRHAGLCWPWRRMFGETGHAWATQVGQCAHRVCRHRLQQTDGTEPREPQPVRWSRKSRVRCPRKCRLFKLLMHWFINKLWL